MHLRWLELREVIRHPAAFLLLVNICSALLALAQFAFTLSVLLPVDFAVAGVIGAISGVITQLFDARTVDLTTRLYAKKPGDALDLRSDDLVAGLAVQAGLGLAITLAVIPAALLIAPLFLEQQISWWWVLCMAAAAGARAIFLTVGGFLRLAGSFTASGWLNLSAAVLALVVTVVSLRASPNLDGYFTAIALFNVILLVVSLAVAEGILRRRLGRGILRVVPRAALIEHIKSRHFLMANSLTSFAKVVTRCDILVVAALAGDAVAGTYRVARLAYDALLGLVDAIHQFYSPTLVAAVLGGDKREFHALKTQLVIIGGAAGLSAVAASLAILGPLAAMYFPAHQGAVIPTAVFAGLITINIGIHGWLWPQLVAEGRVGVFALLSLAGAIVQVLALVGLGLAGNLSAAAAAAANWLPALITYAPYCIRRP